MMTMAFKPIENSLEGSGKLRHLETNGVLDALLFYAIGVVIYVVMRSSSRRCKVAGRHVDPRALDERHDERGKRRAAQASA
jgi:hypothetical protein